MSVFSKRRTGLRYQPEIHTASILDGTVLSSLLNHTLLGKRGVGRPRHLEAVLRKKLEREREKHYGSLE